MDGLRIAECGLRDGDSFQSKFIGTFGSVPCGDSIHCFHFFLFRSRILFLLRRSSSSSSFLPFVCLLHLLDRFGSFALTPLRVCVMFDADLDLDLNLNLDIGYRFIGCSECGSCFDLIDAMLMATDHL